MLPPLLEGRPKKSAHLQKEKAPAPPGVFSFVGRIGSVVVRQVGICAAVVSRAAPPGPPVGCPSAVHRYRVDAVRGIWRQE